MSWFAPTSVRRAVLPVCAVGLCFLIASCDGFFVSESSIQSIKATPPAIILMAAPTAGSDGDKFTLTSTSTTVGGTQTNNTSTATWSSNDSSISKAEAGGVVTAVTTLGNKSTTVTASEGSVTSNKVNVVTYTGSVPTGITISGATPGGTVPPGNYQLTATLSGGQNVTNFVEWTSDNTSVATVNANGLVTVLASATAGAQAKISAIPHLGDPTGTNPPNIPAATATFTVQ